MEQTHEVAAGVCREWDLCFGDRSNEDAYRERREALSVALTSNVERVLMDITVASLDWKKLGESSSSLTGLVVAAKKLAGVMESAAEKACRDSDRVVDKWASGGTRWNTYKKAGQKEGVLDGRDWPRDMAEEFWKGVDCELTETSKLFSRFDPAGTTIPDLAVSIFDTVDRALQQAYPKAHTKHIGVARKAFWQVQSLSLWKAEFFRAVRESRYHLDDAQDHHDSVRSSVQAKLGPKFVANVMAERSKYVRRLVEKAQGDAEKLRATAVKLAKEVVTQSYVVPAQESERGRRRMWSG